MKYLLIVFLLITGSMANDPVSHCKAEKAKLKPKCKTLICDFLEKTKPQIKEVDTEELDKMINSNENFHLIDLRDTLQFERGRIVYGNLINIDRAHIEMKIEDEIKDKNASIVLYCCTGRRSALTAKTLQDMGYTNVKSYSDGMVEWAAKGKPVMTEYGIMKLQ